MKIIASLKDFKNLTYYLFFKRLKSGSSKIESLKLYYAILKRLQVNEKKYFFFFPYWSIGGAERVHADILKVCSNLMPVSFITGQSINEGFKEDFERNSLTIETWQIADNNRLYIPLLKKIADNINKTKNAVAFGCNSHLFYHLIPYLESHVKIVDLTHAFSGPEGFEYTSLPLVSRISNRVVLGNKTKTDFMKLYKENNISFDFLNRFVFIPNKVDVPSDLPLKNINGSIKILFVARNSPEKRVSLFLRITAICAEKNLPVEFRMIGDFDSLKDKINANTSIIGEISNKEVLNSFYAQAHLLFVTSYREGFPMVILEGMSYGVIPVSTSVGEISAYINPVNRNGFLIETSDDDEITALRFMDELTTIVNNRIVIGEYSKNAYNYVKAHFNTDNFEKSYIKLISE